MPIGRMASVTGADGGVRHDLIHGESFVNTHDRRKKQVADQGTEDNEGNAQQSLMVQVRKRTGSAYSTPGEHGGKRISAASSGAMRMCPLLGKDQALWAFTDECGIEWDAHPVSFIIDYLLAIQCSTFAVYIATPSVSAAVNWPLYVIYFALLGTSAAYDGLLHHIAFQAVGGIASSSSSQSCVGESARIFGFHWSRDTVTGVIQTSRCIGLGTFILSSYVQLLITAHRPQHDWAWHPLAFITIAGLSTWLAILTTRARWDVLGRIAAFVPVFLCLLARQISPGSYALSTCALQLASGVVLSVFHFNRSPDQWSTPHSCARGLTSMAAACMFLESMSQS